MRDRAGVEVERRSRLKADQEPSLPFVDQEDSLPGLGAARAAGMRCAMLTTSHPSSALAEAGADVVWTSFAGHDPAELLALVDR